MFILYGPKPYAPKPYAPKPYGPKPYGPKPYAPKPYAPKPHAPKTYAPKPYDPEPYAPNHMLQRQMVSITMEPSAGHVIKYYKGVLDIMHIAVGIKKLLKTTIFKIVRRGGSLVGSMPCDRKGRISPRHHVGTL